MRTRYIIHDMELGDADAWATAEKKVSNPRVNETNKKDLREAMIRLSAHRPDREGSTQAYQRKIGLRRPRPER
jgi:hypothetical protein